MGRPYCSDPEHLWTVRCFISPHTAWQSMNRLQRCTHRNINWDFLKSLFSILCCFKTSVENNWLHYDIFMHIHQHTSCLFVIFRESPPFLPVLFTLQILPCSVFIAYILLPGYLKPFTSIETLLLFPLPNFYFYYLHTHAKI